MSTRNQGKNSPSWLTIIIVAIISGLIGGGGFMVGHQIYDNHQYNEATTMTASPSRGGSGKAQISNIQVNVNTQATKAFEKIKNAVVSVEAFQTKTTMPTDGLDAIFGMPVEGQQKTVASEGSGVIYKKTDGYAYIVTNNHVIEGADRVEVLLSDGKKLKAKIIGHDAVSDLAVLRVNSSDVNTVATFGNSNDIKVGETALAIGSPLGSNYATSLTEGIISAKKRTINVKNGQATVIQTDAAINPGNSGGPLINLGGQVIGINSMKLSTTGPRGTAVEGMGFAIPSNEVVSIINQLVTYGKVKRPALGVSLVNLNYISNESQKEVLKLPSSVTQGLVVVKIAENSPLRDTPIKKYDTIVALGGKKVTSAAELRDILYSHKLGDTVKISYYHNGKLETTHVKLTLEAADNNQNQ